MVGAKGQPFENMTFKKPGFQIPTVKDFPDAG